MRTVFQGLCPLHQIAVVGILCRACDVPLMGWGDGSVCQWWLHGQQAIPYIYVHSSYPSLASRGNGAYMMCGLRVCLYTANERFDRWTNDLLMLVPHKSRRRASPASLSKRSAHFSTPLINTNLIQLRLCLYIMLVIIYFRKLHAQIYTLKYRKLGVMYLNTD